MATIKGLKKLNKATLNELKDFGIDKTFLTDVGYEYNFEENAVGWSLIQNETDDIYNTFVYERFGYKVTNTFFISLMHEVGHYKTADDVMGSAYEYCLEEKERICDRLLDDITTKEKRVLHYQYFNLPDEWAATYWAVNYIKNHPKKSKKIIKRLEKALFDFYDNNITE